MAIIDGTGSVMGRLASHIAERVSKGEEIHVINSESILISGKRSSTIKAYIIKQDIGSSRKGPFYPKMPHRIFKRAVRGMVKYQQPSGRAALKRLTVHIGVPTELEGQEFEDIVDSKPKGTFSYILLGELAESLGAKFR